jgi:ABC-type antimicrobial peptide transport system permease subunit
VFGLVAYSAESRRRELGIRAALGASPSSLLRMIIAAGVIPVIIGGGFGLIGAMGMGKAAESFLIGVDWFDPLSYLSAGFIMLACAVIASLVAAWRIRRISPSEALRTD